VDCKTLSLSEAAQVLGIGIRTAYSLAREDRFPVPLLMVGGIKKVSKAQLEQYLAPREAVS
jgi:excisionase family DNA binding protein